MSMVTLEVIMYHVLRRCHVLHRCHVHFEVRIKFVISECLLSFFYIFFHS